MRSRTKWTEELIEQGIKDSMRVLNIKRMPTAAEFTEIGRNDLHCKISRTRKYRGWAEKLGIELKSSETTKGQEYEHEAAKEISSLGHHVEMMTTKHPFDILVDKNIKVDVKVSSAHHHFGARAHTFRPSSRYSTCDIYVCFALDEEGATEKVFVIPSKFAQVKTLNIGTESKYNRFVSRWDYIEDYSNFYRSIS